MKILYVITGLGQGGAERVVCDLANQMHKKGHSVKIAYLTGEILTKPCFDDIEIIKLDLNSLLSMPKAYAHLLKLIKNFSPDVVHSHMVHANILTRLVRLATPIKRLICTAHNSDEGGPLRMYAYRITHHLADLTTNVSNEAAQAFISKKAVQGTDIITTYNGIDLSKFFYRIAARDKILNELNISSDSCLILAVGRFNKQKDYPNLLHAFKVLKNREVKKVKLLIAGDGELRNEIENKISELELKNDIVLLGRRQDIPELMSAADIFILPSLYEGFGLVVAEAMACKTLVVATDCGGVAEVVGNCGFLVPPQSPEQLANAIFHALSIDEETKDKVTTNARLRVENLFCLENTINKWLEYYKG
ncbi:glycosyltransferase [Acinetobacter terrestris]|uniref:glycosyltransferase n=1 Tax=Acinetobacter terrestris TaxID=2529843 RepID=UPI00103C84F4|nr:glycosyltransferase [Acinetobacter terrestris]TCB65701.1 glycosyltransferase [Acinetobacter terrestris]